MTQPMSTGHDDVVEWGTEDEFRRGKLALLSARLGIQDHHLVRAVAAAGAGLAGLSLLTHWQVTTFTQQEASQSSRIETGVVNLAAWGSGYLLGLLGLVALSAMALYGAPALRPHVRVAGLGWGAGLLGLLVATAVNLNRTSIVMGYSVFGDDQNRYDLSYGPGLLLALAGVAALTAALYLTGRSSTGNETGSAGTEPDSESEPGRPAKDRATPVPHAGPVDLTVSPVKPFVHPPEHR